MSNKTKIGNFGECLAGRFLINKKYQILGTKYKIHGGEIDIICRKNNQLIFVEVKTRTGNKFGYAEEAFDYNKQQRFQKAVNRYLAEKRYDGDWRIDLIAIQIDKKRKKAYLKHFMSMEIDDY